MISKGFKLQLEISPVVEVNCIFKSAGISASPSSDEIWRYGLAIDGCHLLLKQWLGIYIISAQSEEEKFVVAQRPERANVKN